MIRGIQRTFNFAKALKIPEKLNFLSDTQPTQVVSQLPSGIRIFTEQTAFPFHSDIGICFKAGLRNEGIKETGSLFSLNQLMYHITENDSLDNFENTMRTGCMLEQNYDQELMYWKCSFIQEDIDNISNILLKLALTTKTISKEARQQFNDYQRQKEQDVIPMDEVIRKAAFLKQSMGNSKTSSQLLTGSEDFLRFQEELLTPENMIIGYSGVWSHDQFRDYIERKLVDHQRFFQRRLRTQTPAKFVPNLYRQTVDQSSDIDIAVLFEGCKWSDKDMGILHILNQILGSSSSWSSGGPGKGMRSRTTLNLMQTVASVETAAAVNQVYTDAGVFGLRVAGPSVARQELYDSLISELRNLLEPMSDEEFERGQNISNTLIQLNLERQADKLEESVKTIFLFGQNAVNAYKEQISAVTKSQLQSKVKQMLLESPPTVVYYGKNVNALPDLQATTKKLRK